MEKSNQNEALIQRLKYHIQESADDSSMEVQYISNELRDDNPFIKALGLSSRYDIPEEKFIDIAKMIKAKQSINQIVTFCGSINDSLKESEQVLSLQKSIKASQSQESLHQFSSLSNHALNYSQIEKEELKARHLSNQNEEALKVEMQICDQELIDFIKKKEIFEGLDKIIQNALRFFYLKKYVQKTCKAYYTNNLMRSQLNLFTEILGVQQFSASQGNGEGVTLLPEEFRYKLLPNSVRIIACAHEEMMMKEFVSVKMDLVPFDKPFVEIQEQIASQHDLKEEHDFEQHCLKERFKKFIQYFRNQKVSYPQMEEQDLIRAANSIKQQFYGVEEFMQKFVEKLCPFTSNREKSPKGILLYGPPGTGKSAITKAFCLASGFVFATSPMAAGDLKKGIVGESQRTINEIAQRAHLISWDLAFVLIDEIDSLAPDRKQSSGSSTSDNDIISVLLSTMDGSKGTPNLKIIATTNLLNNIDLAFRRRMDIQLFLGNPCRKSRKQWLENQFEQYLNSLFQIKFKVRGRQILSNYKAISKIKDYIVSSTVNFSADSYRKLLDNFFLSFFKPLEDESANIEFYDQDYWINMLTSQLKDLSQEVKNYLGSQTIIDIIKQKDEDIQYVNIGDYDKFKQQANLKEGNNIPSKRILIYLNFQKDQAIEACQVEVNQNLIMEKEVVQIYSELYYQYEKVLKQDDKDQQQMNLHIRRLLCAMAIFENVQIQCGENIQKETDLYNIIHSHSEAKKLRSQIKYDDAVFREFLMLLDTKNEKFQSYNQYINALSKIDEISKILDPLSTLRNFLQSIHKQLKQERRMLLCGSIEDPLIAKRAWLWQMVEFSYEYDADIVKLVDNSYLIQNNAFDDSQAMSEISTLVDEINRYNRAVLIFNLDEISNIKKEYCSLKEEPSHPSAYSLYGGNNQATFNYTMQRPQSLNLVFSLFKNVKSHNNIWFIAVAQDQKLAMDFMEATSWKKPPSVLDYEKREKELDEQRLCTRCGEYFTQRQNNLEFKCKRHSMLKEVMLEKSIQEKETILMEKAKDLLKDPAANKVYPYMIKYLCCGQSFSSKGGEISTRHTEEPDHFSVL